MTSYVRPMSKTITLRKKGAQNAFLVNTKTWNDQFSGSEDPKWRSKVASGVDATGPLTASRTELTIQPGYLVAEYSTVARPQVKVLEDVWEGWIIDPDRYGWPSAPTATLNSTVVTKATTKFNAKLGEVVSPFKGLTFFGELRETIQMLKGRAMFLMKDIGQYAKRARALYRRNPGRRTVKDVGNLWLEYQFGWKPFVEDIEAGITALSQDRLEVVPITASASVLTGTSTASEVMIGSQSCYAAMRTVKDFAKSSCRVRGVVDLSLITPVSTNDVVSADRWGLTLREFVPTVWELVPYSFLVDYFVNVGDVINSVFAEKRALRWSNRTTKVISARDVYLGWPKWTAYGTATGRHPFSPIKFSPCGAKATVKQIDRVSSPSLFVPIVVQYPSLGSLRWGNMAALLTQYVNV